MSYSKKIDLIDKESDLKPKRMFVTSQASINEQKEALGWGKSGSKYETTFDKLDKIPVFGDGKMVKRSSWLDRTSRNVIFKKMKTDNFTTITELSKKYLTFEEYKKIAPQSVVFVNHSEPPAKGTKAYKNAVKFFKNSLINISNMILLPES